MKFYSPDREYGPTLHDKGTGWSQHEQVRAASRRPPSVWTKPVKLAAKFLIIRNNDAGLVVVSRTIGRRVHPKTGRTMIYLACEPTEGTAVHVGDPEELAEVRWLPLAEADELLPGMFEPVRDHLVTQL